MIKHTLLYLCILVSLCSCRNQNNTTEILTNAENIIKVNPDSTIKILDRIDNPDELEVSASLFCQLPFFRTVIN